MPPRPSEFALEALGTLTAANLYQTHLNIGLLADALEVDLYELAQAQEMLQLIGGLLAASDKQLETLAGQPLDPEDKKGLERARQIHTLLREQIQELQAYWKSNEKEAAARFHRAREKSWVAVKAMLNLKD
jgi:cob(I)alamin adenosyltransferase